MKARHKARELALQTLYSMDFNGELATSRVPDTFSGMSEEEYAELEDEVKTYGMLLVAGTMENLERIDSLISEYSLNRPIDKIDAVDRNILRLSIYSLLFSDTHPNIIIDEAVKLSIDFSTDVNYKFINGILDKMQRNIRK